MHQHKLKPSTESKKTPKKQKPIHTVVLSKACVHTWAVKDIHSYLCSMSCILCDNKMSHYFCCWMSAIVSVLALRSRRHQLDKTVPARKDALDRPHGFIKYGGWRSERQPSCRGTWWDFWGQRAFNQMTHFSEQTKPCCLRDAAEEQTAPYGSAGRCVRSLTAQKRASLRPEVAILSQARGAGACEQLCPRTGCVWGNSCEDSQYLN